MISYFIALGVFIFWSFRWIDKALASWKKEQDQKLTELKEKVDALQDSFDEQFGK